MCSEQWQRPVPALLHQHVRLVSMLLSRRISPRTGSSFVRPLAATVLVQEQGNLPQGRLLRVSSGLGRLRLLRTAMPPTESLQRTRKMRRAEQVSLQRGLDGFRLFGRQMSAVSHLFAVPQCGWCDSSRRCMRGDGNGPRSQLVQCAAWFPYACVAVVSGQGNWPILSRFSGRIKIINCDWPCRVLAVRRRGSSVDVIGSDVWCHRRRRACLDYYRCFVSSIAVQCSSSGRRAVACRVFSESSCPTGRPPASLPALPSPTKAPPVPMTPTPVSIPGALGPIIINGMIN